MDERRERDPDTGENCFVQTGSGISDIFSKIVTKITGKTAKKLATKAMEKGVETIGEKNGKLIGETIYDKFSSKQKPPETKGEEIMSILKQENNPKNDEFQYIKDVYNDLLN